MEAGIYSLQARIKGHRKASMLRSFMGPAQLHEQLILKKRLPKRQEGMGIQMLLAIQKNGSQMLLGIPRKNGPQKSLIRFIGSPGKYIVYMASLHLLKYMYEMLYLKKTDYQGTC